MDFGGHEGDGHVVAPADDCVRGAAPSQKCRRTAVSHARCRRAGRAHKGGRGDMRGAGPRVRARACVRSVAARVLLAAGHGSVALCEACARV
eukprot:6771600-Prymnesium_polylepis.1